MRILLISPAYNTDKLSTTMAAVHAAMARKPPLGLLSIGSYLRAHTDHQVAILDNQLAGLGDGALLAAVEEFRPDVVGVTVVSFKLWEAHYTTTLIKRRYPEVHVVWGGPHVGIYPEETLALEGVDSIVVGDGERAMVDLCESLAAGGAPAGIPGLYGRGDLAGGRAFAGAMQQQLDDLPLLDLTLLPYEKYTAYLSGRRLATFLTSRGCPFRCIFCRLDTNPIRLLSVDRVLAQLERYAALGVEEVEFYDETFNITTDRVKEFATRLIDSGIRLTWSFRGRIDRVDREMLELIKRAGCQRIQYGVESGSDRVLQRLRKGTSREAIRRCFQLTNEAGIDTVAYLIIGSPGETRGDIGQTVDLMREIRPTYVEYAIFNLSPGTEAYRMALEEGIVADDVWRQYARQPVPELPVLMWTREFSAPELERIRKRALRSFYVNPAYLARRFLNLKPAEARMTLRTGLGMLIQLLLPRQGRT